MQIGRLEPDSVEKLNDVAFQVLFHQAFTLQTHFLYHFVRGDGSGFVPTIEATAIGADFGDRQARAGAIAGVAGRAVGIEYRLALRGLGVVDGKGIFRRGQIA